MHRDLIKLYTKEQLEFALNKLKNEAVEKLEEMENGKQRERKTREANFR